MSNLPTGWVRAPLEVVADLMDFEREPVNSSERELRVRGKSESELYPYYGATGQVGSIDWYRSEGQRVLLGEDAAPFLDPIKDKAYLASGRFWVNNHAHILVGASGLIDNRFLCHQLNTVDYQPFVTGSTRLKLTSAALKQIPLSVAPTSEQERIVSKLEEVLSDLDAGVAELKAGQRKLAQYRQSLLKAAVEGALTADWRRQHPPAETGAQLLDRILRERRARWEARQLARFQEQGKTPPKDWQKKYPEPVQPQTADLPALPQGWVWASLGQLLAELTSGSRDWAPYYDRGSCVFVMAQNVRPWRPDFSFKQYVDPPLDHRDRIRSEIQKDDLLTTIVGANTGQVCRIPEPIESHFVCQSVALLRLAMPSMSEFVNMVLNSEGHGQRQFREMNYGAGRPHLSFDQLESVVVPLPPLCEQAQVISVAAESFAACDQVAAELSRLFKQSTAQRQNLLRAAFAGQLVPQDPDDEPASVLLERIRAERAAADSVKKPRGRKAREAA